jgi:zinc transport system ATP-binding protein
VAYVPQYPTFERSFPITVLDVVLMGRLGSRRAFRGLSAEDLARARAALERVDLAALEARQIGKLSGGQLQRVIIARALAADAELYLLDEPMSALDPKSQSDLYELMRELAERHTVIVVSHDIGVISRHVRSVGCLNQCLHYHPAGEITSEIIEETYGCPVDFVVHRHEHRVLDEHGHAPEPGHEHGGAP